MLRIAPEWQSPRSSRAVRNVSGVILMQVLPFVDAKCLEAFAGFERGIYAGLDAGSGQKAA
jgi:methyl acetate hydrolase